MTVQEAIDKLVEETYPNEKTQQLDIKDQDGNYFTITGYDWCNKTILVSKEQ